MSADAREVLLLQDQLEVLVEELVAAVPENKSGYEKLLLGAVDLHTKRSLHVSDAQLQALEETFDQAVGINLRAGLPGTGHLLG